MAGSDVKVTATETIRTDSHPNILRVELHKDDGAGAGAYGLISIRWNPIILARFLARIAMPRKPAAPPSTWSVQEARDKFSTVVEAARSGRVQTVTRHGKPVVVMVAAEEFARLRGKPRGPVRRFKDFKAALLAMPKDDGEFERGQIKPRDIEF